jgi:D-alanine--poly(phosphoribitol) ligase subunit 1
MIPTVIHYLRPYFDEIKCQKLKYNLFCGEALPLDVTEAWSRCIPNAKIINVYGPSEATIFCTHYLFDPVFHKKTQNGILSIGKPMKDTYTIVVDEGSRLVKKGETGELCLAGMQLTPGYLNDDVKNKLAFFDLEYNGKSERFYKTGDLCFIDSEGDIMYIGRIDAQVKIQGYRVELPEVEFHAKAYLVKTNVVALAFTNNSGSQEIGLLIEAGQFDTSGLMSYLKTKIPFYMVPATIGFEKIFPQNKNGKTDRKELLKRFQQR